MIPRFIEDVEKDYIPVFVGRVSTSAQRKGLPTQMKFMVDEVARRMEFKKKGLEFGIVQSGKDGELETLKIARKLVKNNPKKKYVFIFRDISRIARDTENGLALQRILSELGIPIIALNMSTLLGKKPMGDRSADLLFQIQLGIAQTGKDSEQEAQQEGVSEADKIGLKFGVPQTMYLKKVIMVNDKPQSVHRRIYTAIPAINSGALSVKGLSRELKFFSKGEKTFGEVNSSQPKKILGIIRDIEEKGGKKKVMEYLEVIDAIHAAERIVGQRDSKKPTRKQKALHRVTVGYLQEPFEFPRPDKIGNPNIAAFTGEVGVGTIEDSIKNPTPYQPSK